MRHHLPALVRALLIAGALPAGADRITEYPLAAGSGPYTIIAAKDGRLWFTENGANEIGAMTTAGAFTHYGIPSAAGAAGIADGCSPAARRRSDGHVRQEK